jgi:hypothetical protein
MGKQELNDSFLDSVSCEKLTLEKRILRSTTELVSSFLALEGFLDGALYTGRSGTPIRFIKRDIIAPHRDSFRGSGANGAAFKP